MDEGHDRRIIALIYIGVSFQNLVCHSAGCSQHHAQRHDQGKYST
jgi:hypothetical protein